MPREFVKLESNNIRSQQTRSKKEKNKRDNKVRPEQGNNEPSVPSTGYYNYYARKALVSASQVRRGRGQEVGWEISSPTVHDTSWKSLYPSDPQGRSRVFPTSLFHNFLLWCSLSIRLVQERSWNPSEASSPSRRLLRSVRSVPVSEQARYDRSGREDPSTHARKKKKKRRDRKS